MNRIEAIRIAREPLDNALENVANAITVLRAYEVQQTNDDAIRKLCMSVESIYDQLHGLLYPKDTAEGQVH